jgi:hypothetical protein
MGKDRNLFGALHSLALKGKGYLPILFRSDDCSIEIGPLSHGIIVLRTGNRALVPCPQQLSLQELSHDAAILSDYAVRSDSA